MLNTATLVRHVTGTAVPVSTLQAVLNKLQITPLSDDAVQDHKDEVQFRALRSAPYLALLFFKDPSKYETRKAAARFVAESLGVLKGLITAFMMLRIVEALIPIPWDLRPFTYLAGSATGVDLFLLWAISLCLLSAGEVKCEMLQSTYRQALWTSYQLNWLELKPEHPGSVQVPAAGWNIIGEIGQHLPQAEFVKHQLGDDPFIEVRHLENGVIHSAYVYGSDGNHELIEFEGRIRKVPPMTFDW